MQCMAVGGLSLLDILPFNLTFSIFLLFYAAPLVLRLAVAVALLEITITTVHPLLSLPMEVDLECHSLVEVMELGSSLCSELDLSSIS